MAATDPLAVLEVVDRLRIGPAVVEPDGLSAAYRVESGGSEDEFVLDVRFEQPVFDPASLRDQNLAAMIAAQPALNYGLFCDEISFAGPYDAADRQFLGAMLSKMARDIFVKKLLGPHPLFRDELRGLPSVHLPDFVRSRVAFESQPAAALVDPDAPRPPVARWPVDRGRCAVLSNGGKSSLLSYGLLDELEVECHPVFVSESERHWQAAGPAYEHFRRRVPETARIWTNADRFAAWMMERLAFLRPGLQPAPGAEDPIQLWTMPGFSFAALPLLRRRGIGRLVRGGVYDTTRRTWRDGIPHHDGLYDRSHYVDRALTRYFRAKGWGVTQFSLSRTLSELLVERILADRYPHLLRLQLSCREPRRGGGRMRPCGQCEECRGLIAMLLAIDVEPEICGYRPADVAAAPAALVAGGVRQELAATEHLADLLFAKGAIPQPKLGNVFARHRPETEALRIDPERSPLTDIPMSLRRPLLEIFLEYGAGAVLHDGSEWIDLGAGELDRLASAGEPSYRRRGARE